MEEGGIDEGGREEGVVEEGTGVEAGVEEGAAFFTKKAVTSIVIPAEMPACPPFATKPESVVLPGLAMLPREQPHPAKV